MTDDERLSLIDRIAAEEESVVFDRFTVDDAWAHNRRWIERKKATVREWSASSYLVGLRFPVVDAPYTLEGAPWMDPTRCSGSGGGFPIRVRDVGVVGTVAVSGLRHDLDHAFIVDAVSAFLAGRVAT